MKPRMSLFDFGDRVFVDGYSDITFRVIAIAFYPTSNSLQLSYFVNGQLTEIWVDEGRCTEAKGD